MAERYGYVLPIEERWWKRFLDRAGAGEEQHAYVRRGRVGPTAAEQIIFYVTHPRKEVRGSAEFVDRVTGDAEDLWRLHGRKTCLRSHGEYADLLQGRARATFILFRGLREKSTPIPFQRFSEITGITRVSPMGKYLTREEAEKLIEDPQGTSV